MINTKIALFNGKTIRKIIHNNEWWFSIIDIIDVLEVSKREPRKYWSDLKKTYWWMILWSVLKNRTVEINVKWWKIKKDWLCKYWN